MSAYWPRLYANLRATSLTPEHHERTVGYWYTVTNGALAHTAFATREGLDRWLWERGLRLDHELPEQGEHGTTTILGAYREHMHMSVEEFEAVRPVLATVTLSNGDYTLALISEDEEVRTTAFGYAL